MEFFLCGYVKNLIFKSPVDSEDDLTARIVKAAATITEQPGNFLVTRRYLKRHCRLSFEIYGRTFEHLL
jgi:hypothetical protein